MVIISRALPDTEVATTKGLEINAYKQATKFAEAATHRP
jgi:hypothetical protein